MSRPFFYKLLEVPSVFEAVGRIVAPGAERDVLRQLERVLARLPKATKILDVGCGPASVLWKLGLEPVGLDHSPSYVAAFRRGGREAVEGSAESLPFPDHSFDAVWSFALLHHIPDDVARKALVEMLRVCRPGGSVVVFDAVMPEPAWRRPLAWALRRLDRGEFMRAQDQLEALLPGRQDWELSRIDYSLSGLEGAFLIRRPA